MALLQVSYSSVALKRTIPLLVILPVDKISFETMSYGGEPDKKYKTLYLLHGIFGNHTDWVSGTRIQRWAEEKNLCVVMPAGENSFYINGTLPSSDYSDLIGKELVEVTRRMFPLSRKREDTYIAGLSMGGYGALYNGMKYSHTFGYIAALSAACNLLDSRESTLGVNKLFGKYEEAVVSEKNTWVGIEKLAERVKKGEAEAPEFFVACGLQDGLLPASRKLKKLLEENDFRVTYLEEDGGHEWDFWDRNIKRVLDWLPLEENQKSLTSGSISR